MCSMILPAFEARSRCGSDNLTETEEITLDFTSFNFNLIAILSSQFGVETLRDAGQTAVGMIDRVPSNVVRHLTDGTFVTRTTETGDAFFQTTWNRWWARLLQADDVSAETEAEIAMIVARDLLSRDVDFAVKETSTRSDRILFGCRRDFSHCSWNTLASRGRFRWTWNAGLGCCYLRSRAD